MTELTLVPIVKTLNPLTTAVLYRGEARAYIRVSWREFDRLEKDGVISRRCHLSSSRPFFLKHELDAYLQALPRYDRMAEREFPLNPERSE